MRKPSISGKNRKYKQGIFNPKNPEKYLGNPINIIYRSGWEKTFLQWCDNNPAVVKYNSEEVVIPYISPIDNRPHRYYIDFYILVKQKDGNLKKFLIEIKPYSQTKPPRKSLNESAYKEKVKTYYINQAKWAAAKNFADAHDSVFCVLTEKDLFKNKKRK